MKNLKNDLIINTIKKRQFLKNYNDKKYDEFKKEMTKKQLKTLDFNEPF